MLQKMLRVSEREIQCYMEFSGYPLTLAKAVKCEISQNTIFKYAMGNGFAILIIY